MKKSVFAKLALLTLSAFLLTLTLSTDFASAYYYGGYGGYGGNQYGFPYTNTYSSSRTYTSSTPYNYYWSTSDYGRASTKVYYPNGYDYVTTTTRSYRSSPSYCNYGCGYNQYGYGYNYGNYNSFTRPRYYWY